MTSFAYRLYRDDRIPGDPAPRGVHREYLVPFVRCSVCGPWGATGCAYPSIRKADLPREIQSLGSVPLDEHQWRAVSATARQQLETGVTLLPGAGFGPLVGRAPTKQPRFLWRSDWCFLLAESLFARLISKGLQLRGSPAEFGPVIAERYIEVEARPTAELFDADSADGAGSTCHGCGRRKLHAGTDLRVLRGCWNDTSPVQRLAAQTATLVVSAEFARAIQAEGVFGYRLEKFPLV